MAHGRENSHKKSSGDGFALSLKIFIPISIISFFNESANGQFCMWGGCEPSPFYYHLPKIIAMCSIFVLLYISDSSREKPERKGYSWGFFSDLSPKF